MSDKKFNELCDEIIPLLKFITKRLEELTEKHEIAQAEENNVPLVLRGKLISSGLSDITGRTYPEEELRKAVDELSNRLSTETVMGAYYLPEPSHDSPIILDLERVSHKLKSIKMEGSDVYCTVELLEKSTAGQEVIQIIRKGIKYKLTPIMTGRVSHTNAHVYDLNIIRVDISTK
jgi:hypothetical protein